MWTETKQGLYKKFTFTDFEAAWQFMQQVAAAMTKSNHHARWQNEWNVVELWLQTHEQGDSITDKDRSLAETIDHIELMGTVPVTNDEQAETKPAGNKVKLFADGGSRGNPGHSASGFVLLSMQDEVLYEKGVYLGITTNNQAEYMALKLGLEAARDVLKVTHIDVYMDSLLVVNQMKGIFKVKNKDLWPVHDAIVKLQAQFKEVNFTHVPREFNKLADAQVNRCLDAELHIDQQSE